MATRVVEHTNIWKLNTGAWNKKVSEKKTVNIEVFYMIDSFDLLARRACHSFTIPRFNETCTYMTSFLAISFLYI